MEEGDNIEGYEKTRTVHCEVASKEVRQVLKYKKLELLNSKEEIRFADADCTGYPQCKKNDCQLQVGSKNGKIYSEELPSR